MGKTRLRISSVPTFINLGLASDQLSINAGVEVAFVEVDSSGLSVVAGRVTLKAGVTYVYTAHLRHIGSLGNTAANYNLRDYTNAADLSKLTVNASNDNTSKDGTTPSLTFIIKPVTDIVVGIRCTIVSAVNQALAADATQASIYSIPEGSIN